MFKKLLRKIKENIDAQSHFVKGKELVVFNILLILTTLGYIYLRFNYINEKIPFWYTQKWGDPMLGPKILLYSLPVVAALVLILGLVFEFLLRKYFVRYLREVVLTFITFTNLMLFFSAILIIFSASVPFPALISPLVFSLLVPFVVSFVTTLIGLPYFIKFAEDHDIITNPKLHQHPGMTLQLPSARGGGAFYVLIFILSSILFIGFPSKLLGFYLAVIMLGILGFVDDYQNTHPKSVFRSLENPLLRLLLLFSAIAVLVLSGVIITTVVNPFGGVINLAQLKFTFDHTSLELLMYLFTGIWIAWVVNLMSWSNGIDGQYSGIVGIVSIFICLLALRFFPLGLIHKQVAIMAAISAGIAFGIARYSWYPSKIMWGFGATSAGFVVAVLSILINTKILISIMILMVPFLDAVVTFFRRILQGKSPLKGDRGHLHHLLLDRGWSVPKIARFYWFTTLIFGLIGYFGSDKYLIQTVLIVGGIVAFVIVLANLRALEKRQ